MRVPWLDHTLLPKSRTARCDILFPGRQRGKRDPQSEQCLRRLEKWERNLVVVNIKLGGVSLMHRTVSNDLSICI